MAAAISDISRMFFVFIFLSIAIYALFYSAKIENIFGITAKSTFFYIILVVIFIFLFFSSFISELFTTFAPDFEKGLVGIAQLVRVSP
jgi:hypothetical protein